MINLKQKSAERQKKEEIADAKKETDRVKRELKREEAAESRLRRDRDDISRKLRRKKDDGKLGLGEILHELGFSLLKCISRSNSARKWPSS